MSVIVWILLFFVNFLLVIVLLARTLLLPSSLLVLAPTALARRYLRHLKTANSKSVFDINVDAKNLNSSMSSPRAQTIIAGLCAAGFALSGQWAYVLLGFGFLVAPLSGSSEDLDERSFEQFTRALAAVGDAVLFGALFFFAIFRVPLDAFTLLAALFLLREVGLVFARRWLESDPEFLPYDNNDSSDPGAQVSTEHRRVGVFKVNDRPNPTPDDEAPAQPRDA
jgi:hypothetical protein